MNSTAKKLRDITQNAGVTTGSGKPYSVIATIKSAFGFDSMLAPGVLLQFMAAKKLRDITQNAGVTTGSGKPYSVIATIKSAFGFDSMLAPGVLLQFMAAIADEMEP